MIIDECQILHRTHKRLLTSLNLLPAVGLSATPLREELGNYYTRLVKGPTPAKMIDLGWLVGTTCYAPSEPDMDGVKVTGGDFNQKQAAERMSVLTGDIITHWQRLGEGRPTICFCVNVAHAEDVAQDFRLAGITSEVVSFRSKDDEVKDRLARFESGEIQILCSVTKLAVGFDSPKASCAIMARPTKSEMLFIQMAGRVMRPYERKANAIIIDHAGNSRVFGKPDDFVLPDTLDESELSERKQRKKDEPDPLRPCPECDVMIPRQNPECPECGFHDSRAEHGRADRRDVGGYRYRGRPGSEAG